MTHDYRFLLPYNIDYAFNNLYYNPYSMTYYYPYEESFPDDDISDFDGHYTKKNSNIVLTPTLYTLPSNNVYQGNINYNLDSEANNEIVSNNKFNYNTSCQWNNASLINNTGVINNLNKKIKDGYESDSEWETVSNDFPLESDSFEIVSSKENKIESKKNKQLTSLNSDWNQSN